MHYLLLPYILFFLLVVVFASNLESKSTKAGLYLMVWSSILLTGLVLSFQEQIHGDAWRYYHKFLEIREYSFSKMLVNDLNLEYGYLIMNWIIGQFNGEQPYFLFMLFIIFIIIFVKSINIIYSKRDELNILSIYVLYPYFLFYIANAKRQGLGLVLMMLAIAYIYNKQKKLGYIVLFITPLFHTSMFIAVPIILLYSWLKTESLLTVAKVVFLLSLLLSISGLNETLLSSFQLILDDTSRYNGYFNDTFSYIDYRTGFRLDFTLFSIFPIFLYYYYRKYILKNLLNNVNRWLALYLLLSSIYQFFSFMPFSDRFAAFSWFIWPILCYEILNSTNNKKRVFYFIAVFIIINLFLLQTYTGRMFGDTSLF